ncbi:MAG: S8 family serine peptidase [Candidatus Marinimicrobia bacterium]|nr:S8 family serine peptidase [bacterium]MCG2715892.1 S8 family serine peptidase [Candidatus Neomarinimicrobiota bacterium]
MKRNSQTGYFVLTGLALLINLLFGFDKSMLVYEKSTPVLSPYLQARVDGSTSSDTLSVWIYFTDKGIFTIDEYDSAKDITEKRMNPRTRWRRAKVNRENADFSDIPVCRDYVSKVLLYGAKLRTTSKWLNAISVCLPVDSLHLLAQLKFVYKIDLVLKFKLSPEISKSHISTGLSKDTFAPATLNYGQSYDQLNQINVIAAHEAGYAGQNVYVLILDTGFFKDHEAIDTTLIIAERDFINNDGNTQDEPGDTVTVPPHAHGTYCLSALGGSMDSKHYGPAYESNFLLAKTECVAYEREIEEDWFVAALEWGDSLGADVTSASLGYIDWYDFSDIDGKTAVTTIAVEQAYKNGILCVSAAGNQNNSPDWKHIITPADAEHVISVGAVDTNGIISSFSSRGPTYDGRIKPEVVARGVNTHCALAGGQTSYGYKSGTSLSTPLVAGAVAVILSAHPDWTPDMVREAMMMTASNFRNPDNTYGWGLVDVMAAIEYDFNGIKPGDIDFDGRFLVTDIVILVRIVLGEVNPHEFEFQAADINSNGTIDISDIIDLVNKILDDGNKI